MGKFKLLKILLSLIIIPTAVIISLTHAEEDVKSRMKSRLPTILTLKAKGMIGENYEGYLECLGNDTSNKSVVDAENKDRKIVYSDIAKGQGTTADVVGKRRAKQIAEKAKPGEWVQKENGEWYQKK
ncbi:MAG TPA: YdbL family protein [Candidatus Brocadiia bacterium]|nr:YdbL family protein [Candidatus Brocadiales bacterium]